MRRQREDETRQAKEPDQQEIDRRMQQMRQMIHKVEKMRQEAQQRRRSEKRP